MEKDNSIVRQIYGRSPADDLHDFHENTAVRRIFMNVTLQVARLLPEHMSLTTIHLQHVHLVFVSKPS